ncbi:MAG: peptidyl-prolyl cis-trans isomerase [Deltaproteobacteria bacterium]|nr:peptidyl-prolyl cis-trans isomerase [Deltaproteobacteria bacterium]MBW2402560.1 peptidyl-prolyl cis-trans isomerase [Deltaproteobacteria bacterium]
MRRLLSEPFARFLILGAAIFAMYAAFGGNTDAPSEELVIDETFVRSITDAWQAKRLRPPTADELSSEIHNRVRQTLLYREGLARGLDRDDIIIQRRVAQKMDFLAAELAGVDEITQAELRAYYQAEPSRFESAGRVSFEHVFFAADRDAAPAQTAAATLKAALAAEESTFDDVRDSGDATLLPRQLRSVDAEQLTGQFGSAFAQTLMEADRPGVVGPVQSEFGWHVVNITKLTPAQLPPFEDVEDLVRRELERERTVEAKEKFYRAVRKKYEVRVEGIDVPGLDLEGL